MIKKILTYTFMAIYCLYTVQLSSGAFSRICNKQIIGKKKSQISIPHNENCYITESLSCGAWTPALCLPFLLIVIQMFPTLYLKPTCGKFC